MRSSSRVLTLPPDQELVENRIKYLQTSYWYAARETLIKWPWLDNEEYKKRQQEYTELKKAKRDAMYKMWDFIENYKSKTWNASRALEEIQKLKQGFDSKVFQATFSSDCEDVINLAEKFFLEKQRCEQKNQPQPLPQQYNTL